MRISRLDKIIENNVGYSTQKKNDEQMVYILQDISATLAMIYDRMCGDEEEAEEEKPVEPMAFVVPFENIHLYDNLYSESVENPELYSVDFVGYAESYDPSNMEYKMCVVLRKGTDEMKLNNKKYGKTWRCWVSKPSEEEREETSWE